MAACLPERVRDRVAGARAASPQGAAVGEDRDEDERLLPGRVLVEALRGGTPGRQRPREQRIGRARAVCIRLHPARREAVVYGTGHLRHIGRYLAALILACPGKRAVDVGGRHGFPPGQAPEREPGEKGRRIPHVPDGKLTKPPGEGVQYDRTNGCDLVSCDARIVQRDSHRAKPRRRGGEIRGAAGAVMIAARGASGLAPAATTRERRSRSVTMPSIWPACTRTALAPSAVIRFAASRIGSLAGHNNGGARISVATRHWTGSTGGARSGPAAARPLRMERAMNRRKSGRASSAPTTSAGMR